MAILGLLSTESVSAERFTNIRRKVFYFYPNGAAPLTGILSMLKEEDTDDPEFSWYEKRKSTQTTTTASQGTSKGPFMTSDGSTDLGDGQTITADTVYSFKCATTAIFRVGHIVKINIDRNNAVATGEVKGVITEVTSSTVCKFRAILTTTLVDNGTTNENVNKEILVIGSSFAQGITDISRGIYNLPVSVGNYTQIFKSPFSITGSALKTSAKYDETGLYKDQAKETSVDHMCEIEKNLIFGEKLKTTSNEASGLPQYFMGGILYYMKLWEAGSTYGNTAATVDTDDNKRIITNSDGKMNHKRYNGYLERVFRVTNNTANEKLVLCGSGYLSVINQMYEGRTNLEASLPFKDTFGMDITKHVTPFGTIYYKSHPLFSQNPTLRFNALFVDVQNLRYRYLQGRDTELLKNRQANDADFRKDEWLTECGLEFQFPESCMYLQNVTDFTP